MIRVLVVDDDFMVARLHSTLVEQVPGFTVAGSAHTGTEALAAVRELRPELVLLDMYLPDLPGLEVLRELRGDGAPEEGPDVLVVTAARDAETIRGAQRGGAVQYIIKPFEGQLLKERLRLYAEHRAALAALKAPEQDDVDRLFADVGGGAETGGGAGPAAESAEGARAGGSGRQGPRTAAQGPHGADVRAGARHARRLPGRRRPVRVGVRRAQRAVTSERPALPGALRLPRHRSRHAPLRHDGPPGTPLSPGRGPESRPRKWSNHPKLRDSRHRPSVSDITRLTVPEDCCAQFPWSARKLGGSSAVTCTIQ